MAGPYCSTARLSAQARKSQTTRDALTSSAEGTVLASVPDPSSLPRLAADVDLIERAAGEIDPVFRGSPQFIAEALSSRLGCRVILKLETGNPVRSFKGRGGDWLARTSAVGDVLACASAGNLGQGVAYGARRHGLSAHVYASRSVNPLKLAQMRRLEAQLHLVDGDFDDAKQAAVDAARISGWRLIEDGREAALAEGAATMAAEITRGHLGLVDEVFLPVGNGSLACGVGAWMREVSPTTKVIGVGSAVAPATYNAWSRGDWQTGAPFSTVAEGLCARIAVPEAVATLRQVLDDYLLVEEPLLIEAVRVLWHDCGVVAEPSGAAALAGAMTRRRELGGQTIVVPVGGSNIDTQLFVNAVSADPTGEDLTLDQPRHRLM